MKKGKIIRSLIVVVFLFILLQAIFIYAQTDTTKKDKLEEQVGNTDTPIGEKLGLGKDRNSDISAINVKLTRAEGADRTKIEVQTGGYIKIKYKDGKTREYSGLEGLKTTKGDFPPTIYVDKDGIITEAYFQVGREGKYVFGNEEINLPKGAGVIFKDGVIDIKLPTDSKLETPTVVDSSNNKKLTFSFSTDTGGDIVLPNNEKFYGQLKFYNGNLYFDSKEVTIGNLLVKNPKGVTTYLDFKGEQSTVPGAYISMNPSEKKIFIGTNTKDDSPSVLFMKGNPYGLYIESTDLFAAKAIGDEKVKSYVSISDKDRSSKDLVPVVEIMGYGAVDEDNGAVGTYVKDGEIYKRTLGRYMNDFSDVAGTTTVPAEFHFYKLNDNGEKVPVSLRKVMMADGKEGTMDEKVVVSNRNEIGIGPDPNWIMGTAYKNRHANMIAQGLIPKEATFFGRGVSNRVSYNYVQFSADGFTKYTGIALSMDSSVRQSMTEDNYRQLIDEVNSLTPESKKALKNIVIYGSAGFAGRSSGHQMELTYNTFNPGTFRHEAVHLLHFTLRGGTFDQEWSAVEGPYPPRGQLSTWSQGNYGFAWGYGSQDYFEDKSTFGDFVYNPETAANLLRDSNKYSTIYRAKYALLNKYNFISDAEFNAMFSAAGLAGVNSRDKYIEAGKAQWKK